MLSMSDQTGQFPSRPIETALPNQRQPSEQTPASSGIVTQTSRRPPIRKTNQPSCNLCRRRKIRCDRADPCSHCIRVGTACVSSVPSNAPRGRRGGRRKVGNDLVDRISRLENLVKHIEAGAMEAPPAVPFLADQSRTSSQDSETYAFKVPPVKAPPKPPKEALDRYLGGDLWMILSEEIHGIRDVLDQSSDEDDDENHSELTPDSSSSSQSDFVICAPDILPDKGTALKYPSRSQILFLYTVFITNVEPVVKTLHTPSLRRYFIEETGKLDCSPGPKGWDALKCAIYYAATTSLTPEECFESLGEDRVVLLPRLRSNTELALARADFVNTEDMSTLQALVLYLPQPGWMADSRAKFAIRSNETSRRTWTLISLAVRIAHALGIHRENWGDKQNSPHGPFLREMRRRLWWHICLLDRQACADRGSDPIILPNNFSTRIPLHVNDEDLLPDDSNEVKPREGFTDMTLALICYEVFDIENHLTYIPAGNFDRSQKTFNERRSLMVESQRRIEEKYLRHCNMAIPFQRYTMLVTGIMVAILWLITYRPLQRHPISSTSAKVPPERILHLSVEVMEKSLQISVDTCSRPFTWIGNLWVQWHALAVMIAELCVQTEGPTVERAWSIVHTAFEESALHVADSNKGRLWRPIKKMMNRAQEVRRKHLEDVVSTIQPPLSTGAVLKSAEPPASWHPFQSSDSNMTHMDLDVQPGPPTGSSGLLTQPPHLKTPTNWPILTTDLGQGLENIGLSDQMVYNNDLNQMAWENWETFIDDFQTNEESLPDGWETAYGVLPTTSNMW